MRESKAKALPCGVFGSFGWSGEAVDELEKRLQDAGFKFGFDTIRVKFKPTAKQLQVRGYLVECSFCLDDLVHFATTEVEWSCMSHTVMPFQICEESGTDLAQLVKKKIKKQQSQASAASSQATTCAAYNLKPVVVSDYMATPSC